MFKNNYFSCNSSNFIKSVNENENIVANINDKTINEKK